MKKEASCSMCERKAHHPDKFKSGLLVRMNRIEGQIKGISKMIEDDKYCDNILNQLTSVTQALNGVKKALLEVHIKSCVIDQLKEGKEEVVEELVSTIGRML